MGSSKWGKFGVSAENDGLSTDSVWPELQLERPKTSLIGQVDQSKLLSFLNKQPNPNLYFTGGGHGHFKASRGLIDSNLWKNVTNSAEAFWWISFHPVKQYYLGIVVTPRYFLKLGLNVLNAVLLIGAILILSDCQL